jgi:hypothetical protein
MSDPPTGHSLAVADRFRSRIEAAARDAGLDPTQIVTALFTDKLPEYIAERVSREIALDVEDGRRERHILPRSIEREQVDIDHRTTAHLSTRT